MSAAADVTGDDNMIASFAAKGYVNLGQVLRGEELARCVRGFDGALRRAGLSTCLAICCHAGQYPAARNGALTPRRPATPAAATDQT
jgi:hypothetical protein